MALVIRKKKGKRLGVPARDAQKEAVFKGLSLILEKAGIEVRREELKRGHGWRATSGFCVHNDLPTLFVDRMLPQDEQISFLLDQIQEFSIAPTDEDLKVMPETIQRQLQQPTSRGI